MSKMSETTNILAGEPSKSSTTCQHTKGGGEMSRDSVPTTTLQQESRYCWGEMIWSGQEAGLTRAIFEVDFQ